MAPLFASLLVDDINGRTVFRALPLVLAALAALAVAYRYYSAFLAARVACLDDAHTTPAHALNDGQNYHPTNRWVLFGHHFAAISGAGPLIGPVLAIQYGYMPGLLWLVVGVCLAGAVQDMLVLAASVRRGGKSLAEIARAELGRPAAVVVSAAILFIVIIALAGLGIVVVKALGGERVKLKPGTRISAAPGSEFRWDETRTRLEVPPGSRLRYPGADHDVPRSEGFTLEVPEPAAAGLSEFVVPAKTEQLIPGSSWGTFTIACTVPIALFVGWYMYRFRKGRVVEASLIGAAAVLAATVVGGWIPDSPLRPWFSMTRDQTTLALCGYGFLASVLPVWMLLCPRDYLSSFLKIGTIVLLVAGLVLANPVMRAPALNEQFLAGGPTFKGGLFPFMFICIMCGAISGFHSLVSSGTTPKMIEREGDVRMIGYGAMLMEGLVGIVALLAAASLEPVKHYFAINTDIDQEERFVDQFRALDEKYGSDPLHAAGVQDPHQLPVPMAERDLADLERLVGGETLRGRTGGAVTLAVGMAVVFTDACRWAGPGVEGLVKYWYHFAIMFEALFILTTIDTGTRIARFLLQEMLGGMDPRFARPDWLPGSLVATSLVTAGWGGLVWSGSIQTIWPMFGIANQLLAVIALALVTTAMVNSGRARYAWVTILPMLFVVSTTMTAGAQLIGGQFPAMIANKQIVTGTLSIVFSVFVITCVAVLMLLAVRRWAAVVLGVVPTKTAT